MAYMNNLGGACFVVNWVLANPLAQNCVHMQSNLDSCVIYKRKGQSLEHLCCVTYFAGTQLHCQIPIESCRGATVMVFHCLSSDKFILGTAQHIQSSVIF